MAENKLGFSRFLSNITRSLGFEICSLWNACRERKSEYTVATMPISRSGASVSVSLRDVDFSKRPDPGNHFEHEYDASLVPVTTPLNSLVDVLSWTPEKDGHRTDVFNIATVPLAKRTQKQGVPKTLVCHDMKGGYIEDRFVQGLRGDGCYVLSHWQYIDTFVYFSHHFITLPPPVWTNAAHRHGVKVLGTLITEGDYGAITCKEFLHDEDSYRMLADKLALMAQHYNFDGWLINIENFVDSPAQGKQLLNFVSYLTKTMHDAVEGSEVIWYDSVITTGSLLWQSELNDNNKAFFDSCDGIFLNYAWNEEKLKNSVQKAGKRRHDVYVGVDVWGRTKSPDHEGGFNCNKDLRVIREQDLSAAIFAPGWVYEKHCDNFSTEENRFWGLLSDLCPMHGPASLPFVTSFCQGQGQNFFINGQVARRGPWYNLSSQQVQPTFTSMDQGGGWTMELCTEDCKKDAFNGGSSLLIGGKFPPDDGNVSSPTLSCNLFSSDIPVQFPLLVSYTFRKEAGGDYTAVTLLLQTFGRDKPWALGGPPDLSEEQPLPDEACDKMKLYEQCFGCTRKDVKERGWETRFYILGDNTTAADHIEDISLRFMRTDGGKDEAGVCLRMGDFRIVKLGDLEEDQNATVSNVKCSDVEWKKPQLPTATADGNSVAATVLFSATLQWDCTQFPLPSFDIYVFYKGEDGHTTDEVYVGRAHNTIYRVVDLQVGQDKIGKDGSLGFSVYPVNN